MAWFWRSSSEFSSSVGVGKSPGHAVLVFCGCHNELPLTTRLKQKQVFPQSWRLNCKDPASEGWVPISLAHRCVFSLCLHKVLHLCISGSTLPFPVNSWTCHNDLPCILIFESPQPHFEVLGAGFWHGNLGRTKSPWKLWFLFCKRGW